MSDIKLDLQNVEFLLAQQPGVEWLVMYDALKRHVQRARNRLRRAKDKQRAEWNLWLALVQLDAVEGLLLKYGDLGALIDKPIGGDHE